MEISKELFDELSHSQKTLVFFKGKLKREIKRFEKIMDRTTPSDYMDGLMHGLKSADHILDYIEKEEKSYAKHSTEKRITMV